ncbi:hypothetical protein ACVWZU_001686 [Thermostichus sp. MS-CIW-26]
MYQYKTHAGQQLAAYATREYCAQIPSFLVTLIEECHALVRELQPELEALFMRQTRRQNFILFSLYTTLSFSASTPPICRCSTLAHWGSPCPPTTLKPLPWLGNFILMRFERGKLPPSHHGNLRLSGSRRISKGRLDLGSFQQGLQLFQGQLG